MAGKVFCFVPALPKGPVQHVKHIVEAGLQFSLLPSDIKTCYKQPLRYQGNPR